MNVTHVIDSMGAFHVRVLNGYQQPRDALREGDRFASSAEVSLETALRERRRAHGADADWQSQPARVYQMAVDLGSPLTVSDLLALNAAVVGEVRIRHARTRPIMVPGLTPNRAEVNVHREMADMLEHAATLPPLPAGAYLAWRLAWLHPFFDGSGRTSRAAAYAMLLRDPRLRAAHAKRLGSIGAKHLTVPERIERSRREYLASVNEAHVAADRGDHYERTVDLSRLETYLRRLVTDQIEGRPSAEDRPCGCP